MSVLAYILLFSFIGSIVSLIGGVILLSREDFARRFSHFLAPFAAGTLLGTAFIDLLPEAARENASETFIWTLGGIVIFFLLERWVLWFHHHHPQDDEPGHSHEATIPLIIFGDTVHNFIDGVVIAGTFLVSVKLGIVTSLAVAAHEIPQEIGDFSLLLHRGLSRRKVLTFNIVSALATMVGALITYTIGTGVISMLPIFISITAGFFIYIASSDIIPEIHNQNRRALAFSDSAMLLFGIALIWFTVRVLD